ncbi:MAG: extracellular solute-binding protein [Aggregatilineales bacterium]
MSQFGHTNRLTRRELLKLGAAAGAVGAAGLIGVPAFVRAAPRQQGLAPGMIGGPTGFEGAERYQYGPDTPAGRAIEGIRALPADRKPARLQMLVGASAELHWTGVFPEGAPPVLDLFERETGIRVEITVLPYAELFGRVIQDRVTNAGAFDIYSLLYNSLASAYEAGALLALDEFVDQYRPDWEAHYGGGALTVNLLNRYRGRTISVNFDGDYQIWIYRRDLFEDPNEQREFRARYGWDLQPPETWEQFDQIAEFFHRPDEGLYGNTALLNPGWGFSNFYQRYASGSLPNQFYFDPDSGQALLNSPAGVQACAEHVASLAQHSPDALVWSWPEQYANMSAGGAAMTCAFANMPKFLDTPGSAVQGRLGSFISPGRLFDGQLVRRSVTYIGNTYQVSSQTRYPEAAYLFLQWANSPSIYTWMVGNPGGTFDPFQVSDFTDPLVIQSYQQYQIDSIQATTEITVPPPSLLNGGQEYEGALDEELQAALTGQKTPEQAMADAARRWNEITDRLGRDAQIEAIQNQLDAWPSLIETPTIES